jgi:hypothetical protein
MGRGWEREMQQSGTKAYTITTAPPPGAISESSSLPSNQLLSSYKRLTGPQGFVSLFI